MDIKADFGARSKQSFLRRKKPMQIQRRYINKYKRENVIDKGIDCVKTLEEQGAHQAGGNLKKDSKIASLAPSVS